MLYLAKSMGRNQVGFIDEGNRKLKESQSDKYEFANAR
jgi:hypothetical protein